MKPVRPENKAVRGKGRAKLGPRREIGLMLAASLSNKR